MQHDNNIENKLRQMEAMEQADLGQMDEHWQQMAGMLQPAVLPLKNVWPKWMLNGFYGAAVVMLIGAALWFITSKNRTAEKNIIAQNKTLVDKREKSKIVVALPEINTVDSTVKENSATTHHKLSINPALLLPGIKDDSLKKLTVQDSILGAIKLNFTGCLSCPVKNAVPSISNSERHLRLQNLFSALEKEEQRFTIDNSRDTLLQFKEGTVLLIPANSFGGMNGIEIVTKEFYKTSDIVMSQLSTQSNKEQLETGGMLKIEASFKENKLTVDVQKPLTLFMKDTSSNMKGMQLFSGKMYEPAPRFASLTEAKGYAKEDTALSNDKTYLNWIAQGRYFTKNIVQTQVKVLNLVNEPYRTKETRKGTIAYFIVGEESTFERSELKKMLKEKYKYYKVKLRSDFRNHFITLKLPNWKFGKDPSDFNYTIFNRSIGDSVWMDKAVAAKYNLAGTATRQIMTQNLNNNFLFGNITVEYDEKGRRIKPKPDSVQLQYENFVQQSVKIMNTIENKYSVVISELGWINCDRFYADSRKKINYKVDLGDEATNYYTMLVFDNIKSMMTGYIIGNTVAFQNIPVGEPVKIISIGINQNGETVYSVTNTTTSEQELKGLQFQTTSAPELKTSLSKLDK